MSTPATPAPPKAGYQPDTSVQDWMSGLPTIEPTNEEPNPSPGPTSPKPDETETSETVQQASETGRTDAKPVKTVEQPVVSGKANEQPAGTKPDTSKPEAKPQDEWPRNKENWQKFVAARDKGYAEREEKIAAIEKEREELRKQIEEVRKHGPSPELESLKKERDELSERLRIADVTSHPKFVQYFQNKTDAQINLAKSIVGADKADKIAELLKTPASTYRDQQIEELTAELSPISQSRIGSVINQLAQIEAERAGEISKARESFATIQAQKEAESKAVLQQAEQSFDSLVKQVQKDSFIFQEKAGDEAWNKGVQQRVDAARALLFGNPGQDTMMKAALAAVSLPAVIQHGQTVLAENEKLKKQVAELTAAQPKTTNQAPPKPGAAQPMKVPVSSDPMEAVSGWVKLMHAPAEE